MQSKLIQDQNIYAKPFLKWAGGKRQLLKEINNRLPASIKKSKKIHTYFEPFLGGGSVFFYLKYNYNIQQSIISDINPELMLTYKCIQIKHDSIKEYLKEMKKEYLKRNSLEEKKEYYNSIRTNFNENISEIDLNKIKDNHVERAAQTIFLNKTCFNGLFRVNKNGEFNVPMGKYENPLIYDSDNIDAIHELLNDNVIIKIQNYLNIEEYVNKNSFVYLDPPYRPISKTSSFTDYYKDGFTEDDQINLCEFIQRLSKKNVKMMLSNSSTNDDFFKKHYSKQKIHTVKARRHISANGKKRKKIDELIITNY